ncbi:hypothetical protein BKA62DRAFT_773453 [Auriculariales sp. MPI-PUGE-AT-0066]|nr:hypothetical protein BKA62DRAFT_773453 [Auriculariales sp. MPI-PUGE-AT-0066]
MLAPETPSTLVVPAPKSNSMQLWKIVVPIVAAALVATAIVMVLFLIRRRRRHTASRNATNHGTSAWSPTADASSPGSSGMQSRRDAKAGYFSSIKSPQPDDSGPSSMPELPRNRNTTEVNELLSEVQRAGFTTRGLIDALRLRPSDSEPEDARSATTQQPPAYDASRHEIVT